MVSESLCFSTTSILRCESLNRLEVILLVIPTAIEVLFATSLFFANWGNGRRHLWITAEGWIYFSLALVEMLSYLLPAVRDRLNVFEVFDTVLAAASSVPIFCYLFFVFLFARAELIDILPRRFQMISKLMLLIFIPAIVTLNEFASFIGVSRRVTDTVNSPIIADVFASEKDKNIWTFFTSLTLALFVAYQAMTFCLAFYRLIRAILNQRHIEATASDEAQFLRGTGWITVGLKFGAVETVIGFAANGFGSAITRRIMRLLARASLIVGLIKGLDTTEDFTSLEEELAGSTRHQNFRRSRLRNFVSNPRHSTLRQLSPVVLASHSSPRAPQGLAFSSLSRSESGLPATEKAEVKESSNAGRRIMADKPTQERVTIHFEKNGIPRLHMRFSTLEIPEFPIPISNNNLTRTATEVARKLRPSVPRPATFHADSSDFSSPSNALGLYELRPRTRPDVAEGTLPTKTASDLRSSPKVYPPSSKETRSESSYSDPTRSTMDSYTSLSTVRELASQFPPLPARTLESLKQSAANSRTPVDFWDDSPSVVSRAPSVGPTASSSRSSEFVATPFTTSGKPTFKATATTRHLDAAAPDSNVTTPTTTVSGYMTTPALSMSTALTDEPYADFGSAIGSIKSRTFRRESSGVVAPDRDPADWIDFDGIPALPSVMEETGEGQNRHSRRSGSMGSLRISWLQNPEEPQLVQAVSLKSQVARIKSIGKAPMRVTPRPVKNRHLRSSLHIEKIQIPSRGDADNLQIVQDNLRPSYDQSVLRDSDVLGMEDLNHAHNQHANDQGYI